VNVFQKKLLDALFLFTFWQIDERAELSFCHGAGGQRVSQAGDLLQHFRGQSQKAENLGHPHPGDAQFPGPGGLRWVFPGFQGLFPLPSEENRVPISPGWFTFNRFFPSQVRGQHKDRTKSSAY